MKCKAINQTANFQINSGKSHDVRTAKNGPLVKPIGEETYMISSIRESIKTYFWEDNNPKLHMATEKLKNNNQSKSTKVLPTIKNKWDNEDRSNKFKKAERNTPTNSNK